MPRAILPRAAGPRGAVRRAAVPRPLLGLTALMLTTLLVLATGARSPAVGASDVTATWSQGPTFPAAMTDRWDAAIAYHPPTERVMMVGGSPTTAGGTWHDDVWQTNGTASSWWRAPRMPSGFTPRGGSAMAYHPPTGDLVLFSGGGDEWPYPNDTWLFNGNAWRKGPAAPAGLKGRIGARMVYDPGLGQLVLHGGAGEEPFLDTWLYDAAGWHQGPSPHRFMEPRAFFGMAYSGRLGKVIVTGGSADQESFYFNGDRWVNAPDLPDAVGPVERIDLEYIPAIDRTVLFGGIGPRVSSSELWMLDRGGVWTSVPHDGGLWPAERFDAELVWVDHLDALMLVGGVHHRLEGEDVHTDSYLLTVEGDA